MHSLITTRPTWLHRLGRHGLWQKEFLGCQSDRYLVISGSPDRFIGCIWQLGDRLAAALLPILIFPNIVHYLYLHAVKVYGMVLIMASHDV